MTSKPGSWIRCIVAAGFLFQLSTVAQDVADISLFRSGSYLQLGDSAPEPIPETPEESPFILLSVMQMTDSFLSDPDNLLFVSAVTMDPPTGLLRGMDFIEDFAGFVYFDTFTTALALENAFRAGTYQFTFGSLIVGDEVFNLSLPNASMLAPPQILNFEAAQAVDPTRSFVFNWTPDSPDFGGARLEVYDTADGTQAYDSGPILGAVSSAEIPANTLQIDRSYQAEITFTRFDVLENESIPTQAAGSMVTTRVSLKTSSGVSPTVRILSISVDTADQAVLVIECTPGIPLSLQQAGSLTANWETVRAFTPDTSPAEVTLSAGQFGNAAFFNATQ
ncbi:MAG TPA: hypothetical protein PLX89_07185 [Verrucomicrobiota bacterium]|nr:hypothetical protein [Verrucomicrobiota bacterium]